MENLPFIIATIFSLALLGWIAFPHIIELKHKREKVGPSYWGFYEGEDPNESEAEKTIEFNPLAAKQKPVIGSGMYASGRGVSTRR